MEEKILLRSDFRKRVKYVSEEEKKCVIKTKELYEFKINKKMKGDTENNGSERQIGREHES